MSQASAAQKLPAFTGGPVHISTEHAVVLDALCEGLQLVARHDPAMQGKSREIAQGLCLLGTIAQSNAGARNDAPADVWQARLQHMSGVANLLMLEKRGTDFRQGLVCSLDARNRPFNVVYDDNGSPPCLLDFTVARDGAAWVLRQRCAEQPAELALGDVADLNWAPSPPEMTSENTAGSVSAFLSGITAKLPPEKTVPTPSSAAPEAGRAEPDTPPPPAASEPAASASAGIAWYYSRDNRQYGPVDEQALRGLFLDGTLTEESLLWNKSLDEWRPARVIVPSFVNTIAPPPLPEEGPPPLPASPPTLDWYYAKQGQRQGPAAETELRRLLAMGELPPDTLVWNKTLSGWLPAAETGLISAPAPADRQPAVPAPEQPPSPAMWYYLQNGAQTGPVPEEELKRLLTAGQLPPDTLVWAPTLTEWQDAARAGLLPAVPVKRLCEKCGSPLKPGKRFCGKCGKPVT